MRLVSSLTLSASATVLLAADVSCAFSTEQTSGTRGSVTLRVSCAYEGIVAIKLTHSNRLVGFIGSMMHRPERKTLLLFEPRCGGSIAPVRPGGPLDCSHG